jgi:hypothetical protein
VALARCPGPAGFFLALGGLIEDLGVAGAFVAATVAALAIQAGSLALLLRPARA